MGDHEIKAEVEDAEKGTVIVFFNQHHTRVATTFRAEFKVRFNDGRLETYPNDDYLQVNIIGGV